MFEGLLVGDMLMRKLNVERLKKILLSPESFNNLKKLNNNILAYGELEYLLGYYTCMFKDFKKLCNEVSDLKTALEVREDFMKIISKNSSEELNDSIKLHVDAMFVALVHNINNKKNRYGMYS